MQDRVTQLPFPIRDQSQRRRWLLEFLIQENPRYGNFKIPNGEQGQDCLLRDLLTVRPAQDPGGEFLRIQDEYLQEELAKKEIADAAELEPVPGYPGLCLRQGDIASLRCGAVVNSSDSALMGCMRLRTGCVDTAIQTAAGVRLRMECADAIKAQGGGEPAGRAKITKGYHLPCQYVIHTVGPAVRKGLPTEGDKAVLARCYRSCLELAAERGIASVAFPCLSTGYNRFPNVEAGEIAVAAVLDFLKSPGPVERIILNVYQAYDWEIYREILSRPGLGG